MVFFKKKSTISIIATNEIVRIDIAYFAIINTASPRELFNVKGIVNEYFLGRWLFGDSKFDSFLRIIQTQIRLYCFEFQRVANMLVCHQYLIMISHQPFLTPCFFENHMLLQCVYQLLSIAQIMHTYLV